eukprot:PhF_6_TR25808/c0_g1_i3/m.36424/K01800/maiA, GSTZ1; maleylacetoacetate isomerase
MASPAKRVKVAAPEPLILYSYWRSSCSWRVRIALDYKGIPYTNKPINLLQNEHMSPEYLKINPMGVLPALVIPGTGVVLTQSMAILEYIEEVYPHNALLPPTPEQRAAVRSICNAIVSGIQPLQNLAVINKIAADHGESHKVPWAKFHIEDGFDGLEALLSQYAGKYCVGDKFTLADACLVPQVYNARRFNVDVERYPTIARVNKLAEQHPSVLTSKPDAMPDMV